MVRSWTHVWRCQTMEYAFTHLMSLKFRGLLQFLSLRKREVHQQDFSLRTRGRPATMALLSTADAALLGNVRDAVLY